MTSKIKITDQKELEEFVRTHLGHRLTAMASPICLTKNHPLWNQRNDAYRAAKEGSYSMLRLFIEFLGVKADRKNPNKLTIAVGEDDTILLDAFSNWGVKKVEPKDFGSKQAFMARVHRTLCKINAHFTYDDSVRNFYDRIVSPDDKKEWEPAVEIVVGKLDEYFYQKVKQPIVVHCDLVGPFTERFTGLKSVIKGDGLGPP